MPSDVPYVVPDASAADGFSSELRSSFGMDALVNGIKDGDNYVPIILAYGIGGYPLLFRALYAHSTEMQTGRRNTDYSSTRR